MATRISDKPVVNRNRYPKQLVFLDSEGYVAVADRPKGISEEEKARRQKEKQRVKEESTKQREKERIKAKAEKEAKKIKKRLEGQKLREAIKEANSEYKEAVKTKNSGVIGKALDELNEAQAKYNEFKGK